MSIMKRIKDILFDEEEVEIPVIEKKEEKILSAQELEDSKQDSIKEIKMPEEDFSDKDNLKSELTFPFPIEFDEDEINNSQNVDAALKRREESAVQKNYRKYEQEEPARQTREIKDYSSYLKSKEEKKQFKPTPIISPVYGILDQNYRKEDLIVNNEIKRPAKSKDKLNLDEVRKKAYGEEKEETKKEETLEVIDLSDDPIIDPNKTIGELIEEESIEKEQKDNTKDEPTIELSDLIDQKEEMEKRIQEPEEDDDTDLFSLIDSMYEENNE